MTVRDLNLKKIKGFQFTHESFVVYYDDHGVVKQYGSTSKSEMSDFATILAGELRPKIGVVSAN